MFLLEKNVCLEIVGHGVHCKSRDNQSSNGSGYLKSMDFLFESVFFERYMLIRNILYGIL